MTANLIIALLAGRPVEHVHGLNNRVLAEFTFDVQQSLLHGLFRTLVRHTMASPLHCTRLRVVATTGSREQVGLLVAFTRRQFRWRRHIKRRHVQPAHQQARIDKPAEQPIDRSTNL